MSEAGRPKKPPFRKIRKAYKAWKDGMVRRRALRLLAQFPRNPDAPRHSLPGELVISLTSYPARFATLHLTIKSLIDQTVRPDRIVLWIAEGDIGQLPETLTSLRDDRFQIESCEDLRSFKKILPSLASFPKAFILIADDDTYYPEEWLRSLVDTYDPASPSVVFTRGHRPRYTADGRLMPYRQWDRNAVNDPEGSVSQDMMATGNGGVLYPPGSLPPETTNLETIRKFSETSDDVWLYFMRRRSGFPVKRVPGPKREYVEWDGTQAQALWALHRTGKKDEHLQAMADEFGLS